MDKSVQQLTSKKCDLNELKTWACNIHCSHVMQVTCFWQVSIDHEMNVKMYTLDEDRISY